MEQLDVWCIRFSIEERIEMSLIFAETFDCSGLGILTPHMIISEVHKRMNDGQNISQILFDLETEGYNMEQFH